MLLKNLKKIIITEKSNVTFTWLIFQYQVLISAAAIHVHLSEMSISETCSSSWFGVPK